MENNQQLATTGTKAVSQFLNQKNVLDKFANLLGEKAQGFIASVITIVNSNHLLKNATNESIYSAALMAATLDLPLNQNLGFAYIVPFNNTKKGVQEAQFQLGFKGIKQLAIRSGLYKTLIAKEVYEGQIIEDESFLGYHFDWKGKSSDTIVGYANYFELTTGYSSTFYMTIDQIKAHAKKYSQTYKKGFGLWNDDFHKMALKTVSKLHLNSGEAPLSIEMQKAQIADQSVIKNVDTMEVEYIDNQQPTPEEIDEAKAIENCRNFIDKCKTVKELEQCQSDATEFGLLFEYEDKMNKLTTK